MSKIKLDKISEAIEAIKNGEIVIVVDDENRENEGDFVAAAEKITPEMVNFMTIHGRGLICTPILEKRCEEIDLGLMVNNNTDPNKTAFTVSIDLVGNGVTTGISASDRAKTIEALIDPSKKPHDFSRPGHIFPLIAKEGGVLRRTGHTEAAVDLARMAGLQPAGVIVEIMNEDGTMARLPQLVEIAQKFDLKLISIEDLVAYRMRNDTLVKKIDRFEVSTRFGEFTFHAFQQNTNNHIHFALTKGNWEEDEEVPVKVENLQNSMNIFQFVQKSYDSKMEAIFEKFEKYQKGAFILLQPEYEPSKVIQLIQEVKNQDSSKQNISMNIRDYGIGAQIIHQLGIRNIKLITNRPIKRVGMQGYGLQITSNETL